MTAFTNPDLARLQQAVTAQILATKARREQTMNVLEIEELGHEIVALKDLLRRVRAEMMVAVTPSAAHFICPNCRAVELRKARCGVWEGRGFVSTDFPTTPSYSFPAVAAFTVPDEL